MSITVKSGYVRNYRIRQEFIRRRDLGWLTALDVATRLEWLTPDGRPDTSRVLRKLGLTTSYTHQGAPCRQRTLRRDVALKFVDALGCDPVDVGL